MAAHTRLPHEMVERMLLSPDLVPHILGPLEAEDGAAAAVCSQWLAGWKATNEPRRRLKQVPLDFPKAIGTCAHLQMAGTPDGRLVVKTRTEVHILDRSMRVLQTPAGDYNKFGMLAANDDSIFDCTAAKLLLSSHEGALVAEYQLEGYSFMWPMLAPGLLFCVTYDDVGDLTLKDEIIAVDAQTLQLRHRFGLGLLNDAKQLAVGGDELYVCDAGNHRLQVFSLSGEHRRSIVGEWRSPEKLCFVKDRLYLVERDPDEDDVPEHEDDDRDIVAVQGRRIIVLSLQGDILQVFKHPTEPTAVFTSICFFDGKLLARFNHYMYTESAGHGTHSWIIALQGL